VLDRDADGPARDQVGELARTGGDGGEKRGLVLREDAAGGAQRRDDGGQGMPVPGGRDGGNIRVGGQRHQEPFGTPMGALTVTAGGEPRVRTARAPRPTLR
jgi:hypothetical protein